MKEKFEIMTDQEHYSLRWNNHQNHILRAFDTLLQTKTLVDVTLVCAETSIRAHKVVLSACSPFFQRVFSETPCKHPVIVLKDFRGWVVQAIVDFMYRGEISVPQERLSVLIQAGESLQVRGLVDHPVAGNTPTPAQSPEDFSLLDSSLISPTSPSLPSPNFNHHHHARHPHQNSTATSMLSASTPKLLLPPQVFADPSLNLPNPDLCTSPMPRRKQARPRRRSGDCAPQDLSSKPTSPVPPNMDDKEDEDNEIDRDDDEEQEDEDDDIKEIIRRSESEDKKDSSPQKTPSKSDDNEKDSKNNSTASTAVMDGPENLCMKKSSNNSPNNSSNSNKDTNSRLSDPSSMKDSSPETTIGRLSLKDIRHLNRSSLARSISSLSPPPSFHLNNNPPSSLSHPDKRVKLEDRDDDRLGDDDGPHFLDHMDLALASHQHPLAHLSHHNSSSQLRPPGLTPDGENNNSSSSKNNNGNAGPGNGPSSRDGNNGSGPMGVGMGGGPGGKDGRLGPKDFLHSPTLNFPPFFNQSDGPPRPPHSPLSFPHMPSVSSLTLTPPHMFGLDSPLGLFPPGMEPGKMYSPLMEMSDPRVMHHDQPFLKKKLNRPKGQHSAPRGGPPRSWTNAELTEALQHVWNKKMTTSQASRIFGIPYNSLLMYVRGKYGKSLKLEQLRKDCISGPPIELLQMGMNNNNNKDKKDGQDKDMPHHHPGGNPNGSGNGGGGGSDRGGPRSASSEPELLSSPNTLFNPFPPGFYPDFPGGFPGLPLSMLNLLPPDRHHPSAHQLAMSIDEDCKSDRSKQSMDDDFPQPLALNRSGLGGRAEGGGSGVTDRGDGPQSDSRREIYQQNGQD